MFVKTGEKKSVNKADDVQKQVQSLTLLEQRRNCQSEGFHNDGKPDEPCGVRLRDTCVIGQELHADEQEKQQGIWKLWVNGFFLAVP